MPRKCVNLRRPIRTVINQDIKIHSHLPSERVTENEIAKGGAIASNISKIRIRNQPIKYSL